MEFIEDENNKDIKVLTVTNNSERIVRLVSKFETSFTVEVLYLTLGQYRWEHEEVHIGREELLAMADAIRAQHSE